MTPHQQRFKEANARCRLKARMPKAETWKRFGKCMKRELGPQPEKKPQRAPRRAHYAGKLSSVCFRRKSDAVRKFADRNRDVIDAFGGLFNKGSKGEFDSVNERYGLKGKRRVVNIQQAIARVLPAKAPYCLDQIDLETLNETAPARHAGDFRLPQEAEEQIAQRRYVQEYEQHYRDQFEGARRRRRRRR